MLLFSLYNLTTMAIIELQNLIKEFSFNVHSGNFFRDIFNPLKKKTIAVDNISLSIEKGESVAFIGPNGAGKSTTIKMLTGILYPTSGKINVCGFNPQKDREKLSYHIGTVFAQRSQLLFNLPIKESFELFGKIYDLSSQQVKARIDELVYLFDMKDFITSPTKKLSLGQRMRAEIALSLIHNPEVIFLDEPTIGLDVVAKKILRETLSKLNKEKGVTLFLTSHDAGDIEALSDRTIIINYGKIIVDSPTNEIKKKYFNKKNISLVFENEIPKEIAFKGVTEIKRIDNSITLELDTTASTINDLVNSIVDKYSIKDINIEDPRLEEIIRTIYGENRA